MAKSYNAIFHERIDLSTISIISINKMKILWITTFRSFGISSKNDNVQKKFLRSLEDLKQDITLAVTIFNEKNIKKNINKFKFKKKFFINKKKTPS